MNRAFKSGKVLWIITAMISLLCAVGLLLFMLQERNKRIESEEKLAKTEQEKRTVEIKFDQAQFELIQVNDKMELLQDELEQEKNKGLNALAQLDKKDAQLKELEIDLANEKKQSTSLAGILAQLRERHENLEEELKQARLKLKDSQGQLAKFTGEGGVELKRIVVKPKKELSGKVLVVNGEFHFVVIDLGKQDEVALGDEFLVYRGPEEIGKVRVEKVYEAMSTAVILPGSQEQMISEDSIVKSF